MIRSIVRVTHVLAGAITLALFASVAGAHASGFKVLYSFTAGADGCYPARGVILR